MRNVLVAVIIGVILAVGIWISWQLRGSRAANDVPPAIEVLDAPGTSAQQTVRVADYNIRLSPDNTKIARIDYELVQAAPIQPPPTITPIPVVQTQSEPSPTPVLPTQTPAPPTATPAPVIQPTSAPVVNSSCNGVGTVQHTVVAGDTLYGIAERYGTTVVRMAECDIASGDMIPGRVISVPQGTGTVVSTNRTCTSSSRSHVVQAGENVFRIGLRYNVDKDAIRVANNLNVNYLIFPGDVLCIP